MTDCEANSGPGESNRMTQHSVASTAHVTPSLTEGAAAQAYMAGHANKPNTRNYSVELGLQIITQLAAA